MSKEERGSIKQRNTMKTNHQKMGTVILPHSMHRSIQRIAFINQGKRKAPEDLKHNLQGQKKKKEQREREKKREHILKVK